jgi:hypothetical protein
MTNWTTSKARFIIINLLKVKKNKPAPGQVFDKFLEAFDCFKVLIPGRERYTFKPMA